MIRKIWCSRVMEFHITAHCITARITHGFGFHLDTTPNTFTIKTSVPRNSVGEQHFCPNPQHNNMHCHVGAFLYASCEGDRPISRSGEDGILNVMSECYHGQLWYTTLYKTEYLPFSPVDSLIEWRRILFPLLLYRLYLIMS